MRITTRSVAKSTLVAIMTAFAALILGVTQSLTTAVTASLGLTAVQALIVPGTGTPHPQEVTNYMQNARSRYLVPGGDCASPPADATCALVPVDYIAQFWPIPLAGWGGLQGAKWNVSVQSGVTSLTGAYTAATTTGDPIVIFGYSQGATVASLFKTLHADDPDGLPTDVKNRTTYFFIGNPQRGDGGFFERFAILGTVPILDATFGNPTPTDTCLRTEPCATDAALMYDGVVDFPEWILNPLAIVNAAAGFQYVHGTYLAPKGDDEPPPNAPYGYAPGEVEAAIAAATADCSAATYCERTGDTIFITLPARVLPMYQPLLDIGSATGTSVLVIPIVDLLQPATQTLIETAYTRDDYGNPSPATLLPRFNPFQVAGDLVNDIPEGINNALTPGLQPLPPLAGTGPDAATTMTIANDTNTVVEKPKLLDKPLTRLSLFAKPNEGITATGAGGTDQERPLRAALGDVHPVRDTVNAVSGAVKKALGQDDDASDSED